MQADLWLRLLGKSGDQLPAGAEVEFIFTHAPRSWMAFVVIAVAVALLYVMALIYRRESDACPPRWKLALTGLRGLTLLVGLLIFLGPALAYSVQRTVEPFVLLLLDDSLSMSIRDRYRDDEDWQRLAQVLGRPVEALRAKPPSRAEVVDGLLRRQGNRLLKRFAERGKVRILTFSNKVVLRDARGMSAAEAQTGDADTAEAGLPRGEPVPPLDPTGKSTNLARGMREALKLSAGTPVAGMIIVSDGQNTAGDDPAAVAQQAGTEGIPIFTVGVGDEHEPKNLRIADFWGPENAFRNDPILLQATIEAKGFDATSVALELRARKADEAAGDKESETVVARQTLALTPGKGPQNVTLKHVPKTPGTFVYTLHAVPQEDELLASDNQKSMVVNILDEQVKVLLVAGSPSWDYRLVKDLLTRDKTVNLSCWLQSMDPDMLQAGNTPIKCLPSRPEELFVYDALLLLDPDPAEFNQAWSDALKRFLSDHAGGLLWMAGPQFSYHFFTLARTRGVAEVLPVQLRGLEARGLDAMGTTRPQEWPLRVHAEGTDHPILQIEKDAAKIRDIWESLPGVYWSFPVYGAKPGTQVLLEHSNPRLRTQAGARPLLVSGRYGPGRTVFLGFQSTWRWRRPGVRYFEQFWMQSVRYLLSGRLVRGRRRGRVLTDRDVYAVGDRVAVTAKLFDAGFRPLTEPTVTARLVVGKTQVAVVPLRATADRPGEYEGSFFAGHLGLNELRVEMAERDGRPVYVTRQFSVEMPNIEFADPRLRSDQLREIAMRSNGRYVDLDAMDRIVEWMPQRREVTVIHGRPIALWDTTHMLLLLVSLLTAEWALRKRFRLL